MRTLAELEGRFPAPRVEYLVSVLQVAFYVAMLAGLALLALTYGPARAARRFAG